MLLSRKTLKPLCSPPQAAAGNNANARVTAAPNWPSAADKRKFLSLPHIIYSVNKRDVAARDVARLLSVAKAPYMQLGSEQKLQHFSYWSATPDQQHLEKLHKAIEKSLVVVAAFANVDVYIAHQQGSRLGPATASAAWQPWPSWKVPVSSKVLVGFARAIGDASLVATVYDLAVHPDVQGFGVGQRLLRLMVQQLYSRGIYDIGVVAPSELMSFFSACSFGEDEEDSTFMTYLPHIHKPGLEDQGHMGDLEASELHMGELHAPELVSLPAGWGSADTAGLQQLLLRKLSEGEADAKTWVYEI